MELKLEGVDEVVNNLKALDSKLKNGVLKKAPTVGANVILGIAKSLAPVRTGVLQSNIRIRSANQPSKGIYRASTGVGQKDWTGPAFYASFELWGHFVGSRKLGANRKHVEGNDFLKKAAEQAGEKAAQAMIDTIAQGITDIKL
jgi:HK97 gp10 family phage protein